MSFVQEWVSALVEADAALPSKFNGHAVVDHSALDPSGSGTPLPPYSPSVGASSGSVGKDPLVFVTLAVFNEHAIQREGHKVSWQAESSGEHHRLTWTV